MIREDVPSNVQYRGNFPLEHSTSIRSIEGSVVPLAMVVACLNEVITDLQESAIESTPENMPVMVSVPENFLAGNAVSFYSNKTDQEMHVQQVADAQTEATARAARYEQYLLLSEEFGHLPAAFDGFSADPNDSANVIASPARGLTMDQHAANMQELEAEFGDLRSFF